MYEFIATVNGRNTTAAAAELAGGWVLVGYYILLLVGRPCEG